MPATTDRITKTPDICGGDACIRGHRIPVWVLVNYRRLAGGDADLLRAYPSLTLRGPGSRLGVCRRQPRGNRPCHPGE